jgi:thiol-disulfide isomerase/thioredoxin
MVMSLFLMVSGCLGGGDAGLKVGTVAPDFQLKDLEGNIYTLSDYEGSPIMLNFWATWCGPCREEMPYMEEVSQEWADEGLVFFAINLAESDSGVKAYLDSFGFTMPVLLDSARTVANKYNITGVPTTYFIDSDGIIQDKVIGAFPDKASIDSYLEDLVN